MQATMTRGSLEGHWRRSAAVALAAACWFSACAHRDRGEEWTAPVFLHAPEAHSDYGMVSTGSLEATRAGVQILEYGGNAVDAAVAAAFALGVADPGGSGLGGMTYILISPVEGPPVAIDGSAVVPLGVDREALAGLRKTGEWYGARAVAVPVTLAALSHALERYGTLNLSEVLAPAISIAEQGYRLSPNSIVWANGYIDDILASRYLRFIVLDDGQRVGSEGDTYCRPDLARTLREIAVAGPASFYRGDISRRMLLDLAGLGGYLRPVDLASVRATEMQPLISEYRGAEVISYPWPGGGAEVASMLNILTHIDSGLLETPSVERLHVMVESSRIARADFLTYAFDLSQRTMGPSGFLSESKARAHAAMITPGQALPENRLLQPRSSPAMGDHTTHISVADSDGNAVSMTQTLCRQYGTKIATPGLGFPYNSCLEFFDYEDPDSPFFLRPRGRYASNMAPTIIRRNRELLILGSAGSDRIPGSVVEVASNVFDRGMGIRDAVIAPRVLWNSAHDPHRVCIEISDPTTQMDANRLQSYGFEHMFRLAYPTHAGGDSAFFGGVNAVHYNPSTGVFTGVGDPRRNGVAIGPQTIGD